LINTFILLAFLAVTPWFAGRQSHPRFKASSKVWLLLAVGIVAILFVGVSGSMAALTTMLFPATSLSEGLAKDFSESSHYLLRLRISHPILSILTAVYLLFLSGWLRSWSSNEAGVKRWSNILSIFLIVQLAFGAATLLTLSPIVMQLGHLLLADLIWISLILMSASFVTAEKSENETSRSG
jgi:heme A synthase